MPPDSKSKHFELKVKNRIVDYGHEDGRILASFYGVLDWIDLEFLAQKIPI
jgi:hypothetical protein